MNIDYYATMLQYLIAYGENPTEAIGIRVKKLQMESQPVGFKVL